MRLETITLDTIPEFQLRVEDGIECALGGMSNEQAVRRSVAGSDWAYAMYYGDELLCLWGVRFIDRIERRVSMWMLSCPAVNDHKIAFGRQSRKLLQLILTQATQIDVLVWVGYETTIAWLTRLGFRRQEAITEHFIIMRRGK
jgi:hypothetical protein